MEKVENGAKVIGFDGFIIGTVKHIDDDRTCFIEANNGDSYSSIPVGELSVIG
jgi:hypothetical protein